ncbi:MAG: hypothetical protein ACPLKP_00725 [Microgenomates group bacterium]
MLILHGENTTLSRQFLTSRVKSFSGEVIYLEGKNLALENLLQALESQSLLKNDKLVVLENFFSSPRNKEKNLIIKYLIKEKPENLIIWEGKKISPQTLAPFSFAQIRIFELPKIIFQFLESLSPETKNQALLLFHRCLKKEKPELIFYFLHRHVKDLIIAKDLGEEGLKEYESWKRKKLIAQARKFDLKKLINFYSQLLVIDYLQKSGRAIYSLDYYLDLVILSL